MKPDAATHGLTGGSHVVIQEEVPSVGAGGSPTTSEVMVVESPGHVLDKGIKKIRDTFSAFNSGIYSMGQGIKDKIDTQVSSLFGQDDHKVIMIQQPHIVTVPATKPVVTHTVMVQSTVTNAHGYVKGIFAGNGHFQVGRSMAVTTPQYTSTYSTSIVKVPGCTHCT
ncbi:uncharacterized protein LOC122263905 [Penaeus japonicus]|uniref:uncharacterized protein LOC122263905 n=1 Tax=Penaeus japonicus TaxID=27405 RepID=UPI001C713BA3|nr:uncharacterized protein LOC122263905 [Penaeus japonicus]